MSKATFGLAAHLVQHHGWGENGSISNEEVNSYLSFWEKEYISLEEVENEHYHQHGDQDCDHVHSWMNEQWCRMNERWMDYNAILMG